MGPSSAISKDSSLDLAPAKPVTAAQAIPDDMDVSGVSFSKQSNWNGGGCYDQEMVEAGSNQIVEATVQQELSTHMGDFGTDPPLSNPSSGITQKEEVAAGWTSARTSKIWISSAVRP